MEIIFFVRNISNPISNSCYYHQQTYTEDLFCLASLSWVQKDITTSALSSIGKINTLVKKDTLLFTPCYSH